MPVLYETIQYMNFKPTWMFLNLLQNQELRDIHINPVSSAKMDKKINKTNTNIKNRWAQIN